VSTEAFAAEGLRTEGASARHLAAVLSLATFGAWAIPGNRIGLGAVLVAWGIAAVVISTRSLSLRPDTVVHAGLALVLVSLLAVRSAAWLLAVDVLAASGMASLAVIGGRTWVQVLGAPFAVLSRATQAVPFLGRGMGRVTARRKFSPALRGVAVGVVLLAVFGTLFATADRAFNFLARDYLLPEIDVSLIPARVAVFVLVALTATALVLAGSRPVGTEDAPVDTEQRAVGRGRFAPIEWALALGLLDLLFLAFVAVQVAVLFGGRDYVLTEAGVTYAQYAREGFFQLVAVAALSLGVVAGAIRWAHRRNARDARMLDVLLGILLVLTLVVLASALRRLLLYESEFGFTRLRISVHATILWLSGLLVLVLAAGIVRRGTWLPRAAVRFTAVSVLAFNFVNPDGFVASRNAERYRELGRVDVSYLEALSPDAIPSLAAFPPSLRACLLQPHRDLLAEPDPWPAWNLARDRARTVLEGQAVSCTPGAFNP
jgi:Domain of unknown function (DUF4173)